VNENWILKRRGVPILIIIVSCFIVYTNSLSNNFVWDDEFLIEDNIFVKNSGQLKNIFTSHLFAGSDKESLAYRPLQIITYKLDYFFWKLDPFGYHLTNILLHILVAVSVLLLLERLFNLNIAFLTTLLFAVHPIHTEAVTYISGRADLLAGLFTILTILFYRKSCENLASQLFCTRLIYCFPPTSAPLLAPDFSDFHPAAPKALCVDSVLNQVNQVNQVPNYFSGQSGAKLLSRYPLLNKSGSRWISGKFQSIKLQTPFYYTLSLLCFFLALLSKEWALITPFLIILIDILFPRKKWSFSRKFVSYLSFFIIAVLYLVFRTIFIDSGHAFLSPGVANIYQRALTFIRILPSYIILLALPHNLHVERLLPYCRSFFNINVIFPVLFLTAISLLSIRPKKGPITFAVAWFIITLLPQSNIIPLNTNMAEHFLYLPSIGFFLLVAFGFTYLSNSCSQKSKTLLHTLVVCLLIYFSMFTFFQNMVWKNNLSFYRHNLRYAPGSHILHNNLGREYLELKKYDKAEKYFFRAIKLKPDYASAHLNSGTLYKNQARYNKAIEEYKKALTVKPDSHLALSALGDAYEKIGEYRKAIKAYQVAVKFKPNNFSYHNNLGVTYGKSGRVDNAIAAYRRAIIINPDYCEAYSNLGIAYVFKKQFDNALEFFQKAADFDPDNPIIHANLGNVYLEKKLPDEAIREYRKSLALQPGSFVCHFGLGRAFYLKGEYQTAVREFKQTLELNPNFAPVRESLKRME